MHTERQLTNTCEEARRHLRISRSTLYSLLRSGQLESIWIGKSRRITTQALEEFLARLANEAKS